MAIPKVMYAKAEKIRAKDLHELLRAWENYHRILTAEAHLK